MKFETVYERKPIVAGKVSADLYAVDAANGTHWVERFYDGIYVRKVVGVRVLHPWGTTPQVCELARDSSEYDWRICVAENVDNDQRSASITGGRLIEEVELPS